MRTVAVLLVAVLSAAFVAEAYKLTIVDLGLQPGFNFRFVLLVRVNDVVVLAFGGVNLFELVFCVCLCFINTSMSCSSRTSLPFHSHLIRRVMCSRAYHLSGDLVVGTMHGDHIPFPTTAFLFNVTSKTIRPVGRYGARDTESGRGRANAKGRVVGMAIKPHHSTQPAELVPRMRVNLDEPEIDIFRRPRTERSPLPAAPPHDTRAFVWDSGLFDDIGLRFNWTFSVVRSPCLSVCIPLCLCVCMFIRSVFIVITGERNQREGSGGWHVLARGQFDVGLRL